jgi:uncharacterized protein YndB with AHSA1/START domain
MKSTRIHRHVSAPRTIVYRALLDPQAVAKWKVPTGMTCHVHEFNACEGSFFRVSLTYEERTGTGKTTTHTDTYHGRFVKLVPNEQVIEAVEFETTDPALRGVRPRRNHELPRRETSLAGRRRWQNSPRSLRHDHAR